MRERRIERAAAATETIQAHVARALTELGHFNGRVVNGHGVFADVSLQMGHLRQALSALEAAQAAFRATEWPTSDDYEDDR